MHTNTYTYSLFAVSALIFIFFLHTRTGYAICVTKPTIKDYAGASGRLVWTPPPSCRPVDKYEVQYTQTMCSVMNPNVSKVSLTNTTTYLNITSFDLRCIRVRAVINENCSSNYSTCAQVDLLESGMLCT